MKSSRYSHRNSYSKTKKSSKLIGHKEDELEIFCSGNDRFRIANISIGTVEQNNPYINPSKLQSTSPNGCLELTFRWSLRCLTSWTRSPLLDFVTGLKWLAMTKSCPRDPQCDWFPFWCGTLEPQVLHHANFWRPDRSVVASKKLFSRPTPRL